VNARFSLPTGIAVDQEGYIYVSDTDNNNIRKITPSGTVSTWAGSTTTAEGFTNGIGASATFSEPEGLAIDVDGTLYVADNSEAIRQITQDQHVTTLAGGCFHWQDGPAAQACFHDPIGVAVDTSGAIYVADRGNESIRKIALTP
jgi:sugar lactone lactonase YvrE